MIIYEKYLFNWTQARKHTSDSQSLSLSELAEDMFIYFWTIIKQWISQHDYLESGYPYHSAHVIDVAQ